MKIYYKPQSVKYMKQTLMLLRGEINSNTKIIGVFNTPVLIADRTYQNCLIERKDHGIFI